VICEYVTWEECFSAADRMVAGQLRHAMAVCDVGGGANPFVATRERGALALDYTVVDVDAGELAKAPRDVRRVHADVADVDAPETFDLVVSRQLAEHVRDPAALHASIYRMLKPGGAAVHLFPTLWTVPFVANALLPERLSERILLRLQPNRRRSGRLGKFPAYYRWCRGPTRGQIHRLEGLGYRVERYTVAFGHGYYRKAMPLQRLEDAKGRLLRRFPVPLLTTYAVVLLRKPG
jgi:SAM-dependent methyltransferase